MNNEREIQFHCLLSAEKNQALNKGIWLTYSIQPSQSIDILPWQTPLEGIMSNLFKITDMNGNQLKYEGPMIKRRAPNNSDFITIKQDEQKQNKVDVSLVYSFEKSQKYKIKLNNLFVNFLNKEQKQDFTSCHLSNEIFISVE